MNNTVLAILVVLLGICVGLAWTNPATQDYGEYLEWLIGQALVRTDSTESRASPSPCSCSYLPRNRSIRCSSGRDFSIPSLFPVIHRNPQYFVLTN